MAKSRTALILGATGNIGGEVAVRLASRGWHVRALHRSPDALPDRNDAFDWREGDVLNRDDVMRAAQGTELIVHAVNPPGYRNWAGLVLPMIDNTLAAARACGARILLPGTVYNFGPDSFPRVAENAPQHPVTRKGAIRVTLERRLEEAAMDGSVRSLIVRAGDYFGAGRGNNWFSGAMIRPGTSLERVYRLGRPGVGHQWAYIPDVAETMVRLVERASELPDFARYHMDGHWDADGTRMIAAIRAGVGGSVAIKRFPWWSLPVLGCFSETFRELRELRYLWQRPVRLDNSTLLAVLSEEPHTDWETAVATTLDALARER